MKSYENVLAKRTVQNFILDNLIIPRDAKFLGLADEHGLDKYEALIGSKIAP